MRLFGRMLPFTISRSKQKKQSGGSPELLLRTWRCPSSERSARILSQLSPCSMFLFPQAHRILTSKKFNEPKGLHRRISLQC